MKFRSRNFCILLYPDNQEHSNALEYIKNNYDYAYILHDKDVTDTGEIKKSHIHVVLTCVNAKWNTALADEIGLTSNFIQSCRNYDNALGYLIHFADDSKHQYSIDEVQGTLKNKLSKKLKNSNKDENDRVNDLIHFIINYDKYLTILEFSAYCSSLGMWDVFRRASLIFIKIIEEHNKDYK
jgi:hypothetical protein